MILRILMSGLEIVLLLLLLTTLANATEVSRTAEQLEAENAELTAKLVKEPKNIAWLSKRADNLFKLHDFAAAIEDYNLVLKIDDNVDASYYGRGLALGRAGDLDAGITDLTVFLKRHPQDSRAYTKRGIRHMWNQNEEGAERDFRQAIKHDPKNAEAHDDYGVILARRGDYADAEKHFLITVGVDSTYQKGWHNLAMVRFLSNQDASALLAVDTAITLRPEARDSLLLKAEILRVLGRIGEADALRDEAEFLPEGNWSEHISVR